MTVKTCSRCAHTKPIAQFNRNAKSRDGLRQECRACQSQRFKAYKASKAAEHYTPEEPGYGHGV